MALKLRRPARADGMIIASMERQLWSLHVLLSLLLLHNWQIMLFGHIKGKGSFYIAQYPVRRTAQSALHFLPSLTDLFIPTPFSASPGSILVMQQLRATTKSLTFPPLSMARFSFIQLSRQGRQWREGKCPIFQTVAKRDSNPGSLDCESGILPLSYRASRQCAWWCVN